MINIPDIAAKKTINKGLILCVLIIICTTSLSFSEGYRIEVKIDGLQNQQVYLGHHYGKKNYLIDTIRLNSEGYGIFEDTETLQTGMYLVIFPSKNYFEFIVADDQEFLLETSVKDPVGSMKVSGTIENEAFFSYHKGSSVIKAKKSHLKERLTFNRSNKDSVIILSAMLKRNDNELVKLRNQVKVKYPDLFFTKIIRAMENPVPPASPVDNNGVEIDTLFTFKYFRNHFFDNFDFSENGFIRTSLLTKKLDTYFQNLTWDEYDSLTADIDMIANKSKADPEMYRYVMFYMLKLVEMSWGATMEELFLYISDSYFLNDRENWSADFISKLEERTNEIIPTLIGKTGADLKMEKPDGEFVRLYQVDSKYKVLIFWDTECKHCQETMPDIVNVTKKAGKKFFKYFAVYVGVDKIAWTDFIEQNDLDWINVYDPLHVNGYRDLYDIYRTPEIYILDKDNIIIERRINPYELEETLARLKSKS